MRNAFIAELLNISKDERVLCLLADNGIIVFDEYRRQRPKQLVNLGIAESNLIGMAAGLALCGYMPFVYTIGPFLTMRPYEYIRNDVCYQNTNVKLVGIGAGFAYSTLGPTHHLTEDVSILSCLPNITIISPADPIETVKATRAAYNHVGPVYLRIGTGKNPVITDKDSEFSIGRGMVIREGNDVGLISTGDILAEVIQAAELLQEKGISARVINMSTLKPLDDEIILETAEKTKAIISIEEHNVKGGLGSSIADILCEKFDEKIKFKKMGLVDKFCKGYGSLEEIRKSEGLYRTDIQREAEALLT